MMSETFVNINKVQSAFQDSLRAEVGSVLEELMALDDEKDRAARRRLALAHAEPLQVV